MASSAVTIVVAEAGGAVGVTVKVLTWPVTVITDIKGVGVHVLLVGVVALVFGVVGVVDVVDIVELVGGSGDAVVV